MIDYGHPGLTDLHKIVDEAVPNRPWRQVECVNKVEDCSVDRTMPSKVNIVALSRLLIDRDSSSSIRRPAEVGRAMFIRRIAVRRPRPVIQLGAAAIWSGCCSASSNRWEGGEADARELPSYEPESFLTRRHIRDFRKWRWRSAVCIPSTLPLPKSANISLRAFALPRSYMASRRPTCNHNPARDSSNTGAPRSHCSGSAATH